VANVGDTHYLLGSVLGPHPYPLMVREFQSVIGREPGRSASSRWAACRTAWWRAWRGSNALGIFDAFIDDAGVRLVGVEAGGESMAPDGTPHVLPEARPASCKARGLRPAGRRGEHRAHAFGFGRLDYAALVPSTHGSAPPAGPPMSTCLMRRPRGVPDPCPHRGDHSGPESAHAVAYLSRLGALAAGSLVLVNLSGRGDKDVQSVEHLLTSARRPR